MKLQFDVATGRRRSRLMRCAPLLLLLLVTACVNRHASEAEQKAQSLSIVRRLLGTEGQPAHITKPREEGEELVCPVFEVRQEASHYDVYLPKQPEDPKTLRYEVGFEKTSRECDFRPDYIAIKYGFAGRVIVGPAGAPGEVTVPIRVELASKKDKLAWSKRFKIPVRVPPGAGSQFFTHIGDDMVYQLRYGEKLSDLRIYIGFDTGQGWAKPAADAQ